MIKVVIESPYAGEVDRNTIYARRCMADSLRRGEAPFLSHLLYTQVLDDLDPEQRTRGIKAGFTWAVTADLVAVYIDYGESEGMAKGVARAQFAEQNVEYRSIGKNPYRWAEGLGDK